MRQYPLRLFLKKKKNKYKSIHINVAIQLSRCVGIVGNFVWCKEFFARRDKLTISGHADVQDRSLKRSGFNVIIWICIYIKIKINDIKKTKYFF